MLPIALDNDRELAAEIGLLLSCYAIIDLFLLHIYVTVSGQTKESADIVLGRIKSNMQRIELMRDLILVSNRVQKEHELNLLKKLEAATQLRNEYAHAIYSQVAASTTKWGMSMWLSDGRKRKKQFKDINVDIVRKDGVFIREVLQSLSHLSHSTWIHQRHFLNSRY